MFVTFIVIFWIFWHCGANQDYFWKLYTFWCTFSCSSFVIFFCFWNMLIYSWNKIISILIRSCKYFVHITKICKELNTCSCGLIMINLFKWIIINFYTYNGICNLPLNPPSPLLKKKIYIKAWSTLVFYFCFILIK